MLKSLAACFVLFLLMNCKSQSPQVQTKHISLPPSLTGNTADITSRQKEKSRLVPAAFKRFDFRNFKYHYASALGRKVDINLRSGEHEYDVANDRGWFSMADVYYADVTGDGNPEAIVHLSHVSCGVSCDGGAALFYVYTLHQGELKLLWRYETGSLAYGCGLKYLAVKNQIINLELFGRCVGGSKEFPGTGKFGVEDATRLTFAFNGRTIAATSRRIIPVPERSVLNCEPKIEIN